MQAGVVLLGGAQLGLGVGPLGAEANLLGGVERLVDDGQGLPGAHHLAHFGRQTHDAPGLGHYYPALTARRRRYGTVEREAVVGVGVAGQGRAHPKQELAFLGQSYGIGQGHTGRSRCGSAVVFAAVGPQRGGRGQQHGKG